MDFDIQKYSDQAIALIINNGPSLLLAIITLFIGLKIIKALVRIMNKGFEKNNMDASLRKFLSSLITWGSKVILFISVAQMIGIATTSFVAIIGAAGLAIGLALQGTLANFAGGALILIFKPFKVGDLVEAQGYFGEVEEIQIFITKVITPQNKTVIIPNGILSNGSITNYTEKGAIRIDLTIGISYDSDIKLAKEKLEEAMRKDDRVLKDPAPMVAVSELGDSSVNLAVRPWCHPSVYWDVYFETLENGKAALDEANITIPFPQRDVHLFQHKS